MGTPVRTCTVSVSVYLDVRKSPFALRLGFEEVKNLKSVKAENKSDYG